MLTLLDYCHIRFSFETSKIGSSDISNVTNHRDKMKIERHTEEIVTKKKLNGKRKIKIKYTSIWNSVSFLFI